MGPEVGFGPLARAEEAGPDPALLEQPAVPDAEARVGGEGLGNVGRVDEGGADGHAGGGGVSEQSSAARRPHGEEVVVPGERGSKGMPGSTKPRKRRTTSFGTADDWKLRALGFLEREREMIWFWFRGEEGREAEGGEERERVGEADCDGHPKRRSDRRRRNIYTGRLATAATCCVPLFSCPV